MSYDPTQLSTNATYRVRFTLQDTDVDNEFMTDDEISYVLSKYSDDEQAATLELAKRMLAQFAQYARQREGNIETYGSEVYTNWKAYIDNLVKELSIKSAGIIIGGVVQSEVDRVCNDSESVGAGYSIGYYSKNTNRTVSSDNPFRLK